MRRLLEQPESPRLEFKEAKRKFDSTDLKRIAGAIANEGGGHIVLGVSDQRPRKVVGSEAFPEPGQITSQICSSMRPALGVESQEMYLDGARVLILHIPSRPIGVAVQVDGAFLRRSGDSLVGMDSEELRRIHAEAAIDFSSQIVADASLQDLDDMAVENFRQRWIQARGNENLASLSRDRLLEDSGLAVDGRPNMAGLILLGKEKSLGKWLGQAEVIFEYRENEFATAYDDRREYRAGFLTFLDELWDRINQRNLRLQLHQGLFRREIMAFSERVVREALLNALVHREYSSMGSIFIRQYPRRLEIVSPGGFPAGVSPSNILQKQHSRNRKIAEACALCGLVERSGQGADLMFRISLEEGKAVPDFSGSDEHQVKVGLFGVIQNPRFVGFLEGLSQEMSVTFAPEHLWALDYLERNEKLPDHLADTVRHLESTGVISRVGRGRGSRLMLSRRFHRFLGSAGDFTRKAGLDRETNKELLIKHIRDSGKDGARLEDLRQVLRDHSADQVQTLMRELSKEGRVHHVGRTRAARWYLTNAKRGIASS